MSSRWFSDRSHSKWTLFSGFTGSLVGSNVCALFSTIRRDCCRPAGLEEARNENCTFFLGYRITELPHHDLFVLFCFNLLGPTTQRIKTLGSNRKLKLTGERVGYLKCTTQPNCCEKGVVLSFQTLLSKITHSTPTANEYSSQQMWFAQQGSSCLS